MTLKRAVATRPWLVTLRRPLPITQRLLRRLSTGSQTSAYATSLTGDRTPADASPGTPVKMLQSSAYEVIDGDGMGMMRESGVAAGGG